MLLQVPRLHLERDGRGSIAGMVNREDFLQLSQAIPMQARLPIIAKPMATEPKLSIKSRAAGTNTSATMRNATVVVYAVPVDFSPVVNMATSFGCRGA